MARVFLLSATPEDDQTDFNLAPLGDLLKCVETDRFRVHAVTNDPEVADVIVFAEFYGAGWPLERARQHPLVRRYREKCFVFCANPFVIPLLPGVHRRGKALGVVPDAARILPGPDEEPVHHFQPAGARFAVPLQFHGFRAERSCPAPTGDLASRPQFFQNTTEDFDRILHRKMEQRERLDYDRRYAELCKASKFVLCPRGLSVSSIRLFETMRMGRVPVILADGWVAPEGPRWEKFSIRIPESEFAQIPRLLECRESEAIAMGELARREWEEWFSDDVLFHRLVELCLDIKRKRTIPESLARWPVYFQFLRPFHFRRLVGELFRRLRRT